MIMEAEKSDYREPGTEFQSESKGRRSRKASGISSSSNSQVQTQEKTVILPQRQSGTGKKLIVTQPFIYSGLQQIG